MSRRRGVWASVALAAASTLSVVVCVDLVAFFALDLRIPSYGQENFFQHSPITGFAHRPDVRATWYRYEDGTHHRVRTNHFGFPDVDRSLVKTRPRIALIGDSTTQFWEAEEEDRPQVVLEGLLRGRYEILNLGVRGFGTDQTFLMFREVGVDFSPDIVVFTFCVNDLHENAQADRKPHFVLDAASPSGVRLEGSPYPKTAAPVPHPLAQVVRYSFVLRKLSRFAGRWLVAPMPLAEHFELRPYKAEYDAVDTERMDLTLALVGELARFVRSRGMRFLLVEGVLRQAYDEEAGVKIRAIYGDRFDFDRVSRTLAGFAEENGIPFLSLPRRWRSEGVPIDTIMHPEDNLHLNGAGARLYSRSLAEELRALGWVPAAASEAPH